MVLARALLLAYLLLMIAFLRLMVLYLVLVAVRALVLGPVSALESQEVVVVVAEWRLFPVLFRR